MEKEGNNFWGGIGGILVGIYGLISQIMAVYYLWQYAKEDSFLVTIFIDPFIAEFKGLLWIFFIW